MRRRTLASLAAEEAPLSPRRAAAVMVAVVRELERRDAAGPTDDPLRADDVVLAADGSVQVAGDGRPSGDGDRSGVSAGAAVGRMLFLLLVGRPPLGPDDAFEPHLRASLPAPAVALLARSCSPAPGQWPSVHDWAEPLADLAGGQAPPRPAAEVARLRRRRRLVAVAVVALLVISAVVVLLAPRWWDAATTDESGHGLAGPPHTSVALPQPRATS